MATVSGDSDTVGSEEGRILESGELELELGVFVDIGGQNEHESVVISMEVGREQLSRSHQLKRPVGKTSFGSELQKGYNSKYKSENVEFKKSFVDV